MAIFSRRQNRPTVGLVLSGGGARGFVQVGALKAFKERGIDFDLCVGTSVGSLVGALYCYGIQPDDMLGAAERLDERDLHGRFLFKPDDPMRIGDIIRPFVGDALIEYLPKKYAAVATNIKTGKQAVLDSGSVAVAVSASSAFPLIYSPLAYNDMNLADGGLVNNIPADVARMMGADKVVTVDVHGSRGSGTDSTGMFDVLRAMFSIMSANSSTVGLMQSDIVIAPDTSDFRSTRKAGYLEMVELGYRETLAHCDEIEQLFCE